jgi:hypothetical protein
LISTGDAHDGGAATGIRSCIKGVVAKPCTGDLTTLLDLTVKLALSTSRRLGWPSSIVARVAMPVCGSMQQGRAQAASDVVDQGRLVRGGVTTSLQKWAT